MTDAKSTPKTDPTKPAAKDADDGKDVKTPADAEKAKSGERDDVADGQSVMERDDIGAADGPGKPDKVKVITEVHPGTAN